MNLKKISDLNLKYGGTVWENLKTKDLYALVDIAYDATNPRDGNAVVIYIKHGTRHPVFVRDFDEFMQKFEKTK